MARPPCATMEKEELVWLVYIGPLEYSSKRYLVNEIRACLLPLFQAGADGIALVLCCVLIIQPLGPSLLLVASCPSCDAFLDTVS